MLRVVLIRQPAMLKQSSGVLLDKHERLAEAMGCTREDVDRILTSVPTLWGQSLETTR